MAVDYLTHISNEELINMYNEIGDKKAKNPDYKVTPEELFIISAMSKRKLIPKSKYKSGLPKPKEWQ
jgi:hypothetical protein